MVLLLQERREDMKVYTKVIMALLLQEPVLQRQSKKGTKVYSKSASTSQLLQSALERVSTASESAVEFEFESTQRLD